MVTLLSWLKALLTISFINVRAFCFTLVLALKFAFIICFTWSASNSISFDALAFLRTIEFNLSASTLKFRTIVSIETNVSASSICLCARLINALSLLTNICFSSLVASSLSLINPRITSAFWWISFLAADLISITGSILEISSILCFLIFLTSSFVWALSIASAILAAVLINLSIAEAFSSTVDSLLFFIKSRWASSWIVISFNACGLIVDIGLILWIASIVLSLVS